jgi:hypothetical protein
VTVLLTIDPAFQVLVEKLSKCQSSAGSRIFLGDVRLTFRETVGGTMEAVLATEERVWDTDDGSRIDTDLIRA